MRSVPAPRLGWELDYSTPRCDCVLGRFGELCCCGKLEYRSFIDVRGYKVIKLLYLHPLHNSHLNAALRFTRVSVAKNFSYNVF